MTKDDRSEARTARSVAAPARQLWLVRHAETEWSRAGRHTGRTDLPLTADGERMARDIATLLEGRRFAAVWSSPLLRARRTCELVGLGEPVIDEDLLEWNYGEYEGLTSAEIERRRPGWNLWRHGCPGGETLAQVNDRAQRVVARVLREFDAATHAHDASADGVSLAIVSHGHFLRTLVAAWLELPPSRARSFGLHADSVSILGFEHGDRVVWSWDWTEHLTAAGH